MQHLFRDIEWPDLDGIRRWDVGLGGGGRHLIDDLIRDTGAKILVEIGVFLGQSARYWLENHPSLTVIGIDPWGPELVTQCERYVGRETLNRAYPDAADQRAFIGDVRTHGVMKLALANLSAFKDRFIPIRATSPEVIPALRAGEVIADIIFIDADKKVDDLEAAHIFWPDAHITGDDWHWGRTKGYPMRTIVQDFADAKGFSVEADHATWVLKKQNKGMKLKL